MERYLQVDLLGPGPRLMKKEFTGPRSHKGMRNAALVHGTNAFTQTVVAESHSLAGQVPTPSCLHSLTTVHVSSYQN